MFKELLDLGQKVISFCEKEGMESAEIFFSYSKQKQVTITGTSIQTQRANEEMGAGIRVIHKGAEGFSYTNILTSEVLKNCAKEAFAVAKISPKIEGIGLPSPKKISSIEENYSKEIAFLEVDTIICDALDYIEGYSSIDPRIRSELSRILTSVSGKAIVNSLGLEVEQKKSSFQAELIAIASDEEKSGAYTFEAKFTRKHDIDFLSLGEELGRRALDGLNQQTIKSFEGPVIFRPAAIFNPIGICIALAVSADAQQRGSSIWKDRLADKVVDESIQVIDKAHDLAGGFGVQPFDDEGSQTKEIEIIRDGILQTFLHNQRTANKENLPSTGNAVRMGQGPNFTQTPSTILPNSPWILTGDMTEEEMIAETKKGIILHNFHGTMRPESGIFSGVAKGAYLIENGEITTPVTGVSIAGNVFEILNTISGIGKEYHISNALLRTPIIKFDGIKITAM